MLTTIVIIILGGIFVKRSYEKKMIRVEVNESDTVGEIKEKVKNQEGITTHLKALKFDEKPLDETRFLVSYYNIQDEVILDLEG